MVRRISKYIAILVIAIASFFIIFPNEAKAAQLLLFDDADIFNDGEEKILNDYANTINTDDYIFIVLTTRVSSNYEYNQNNFFLNYLEPYGYDESDNVIGLIINMELRLYDLFVYGAIDSEITRDESDDIIEQLSIPLRDDDYLRGVKEFMKKTNTAYKGTYVKFNIEPFLVFTVIGVIVAIVTGFCIYNNYKNKYKFTPYPRDYMTLNLTSKFDTLLHSHTSRIRRSSNSSGGSSNGGFHGSSGGGHRGGGRF